MWVLCSQDESNLYRSVGSSERWLGTMTYDARERLFFSESILSPAVQCLGDTGSEEPCYHMGSGLVGALLYRPLAVGSVSFQKQLQTPEHRNAGKADF